MRSVSVEHNSSSSSVPRATAPAVVITETLLAGLSEAIFANWIEAAIIVVALYLFLATNQYMAGAVRRDPKTSKSKAAPSKKPIAGDVASGPKALVKSLVASLLRPGNDSVHTIFSRYAEIVRKRNVNLQEHLTGEEARTLYLGLIGISAREVGGTFRVTELLADMRTFGFPLDLPFYTSVMKIHASNNHADGMLRLHAEMRRDNAVPDRNMYQCLMQAAVAFDAGDQALQFFAALGELSPPPSMRTYMTALSIHAKRNDWRAAVALLNGIKTAGVEPDNILLNNVLGLCVSAGQVALAEQLTNDWRQCADVVSCNILLKGFSQQTDLAKAEALFQRMLSEGPSPNLISFNTVMDCSVRTLQVVSNSEDQRRSRRTEGSRRDSNFGRDGTQATGKVSRTLWELLDQLIALGLQPDRYTLSTLAKSMHLVGCTVADIDRVVKLLHTMNIDALSAPGIGYGSHSTGGTPRLLEVLFNTLLDLCVSLRDLDRMNEIFKMMGVFGVEISSVTYGTLIKAFGQAGRLARCKEVWAEMLQKGLKPSVVTFGCYIDACVRNDDLAGAIGVLDSMSAIGGVEPNAVIYTSIIRGFSRVGRCDEALNLYRQMRRAGIVGTLVTYNSVLDLVAQQLVDRKKFEEVCQDMRDVKVAPDTMSLSIMVKAFVNFDALDSALNLLKDKCKRGVAPDSSAFNALLVALTRAGREVDSENVLTEMMRAGMSPTNAAVALLVKMYGKAQKLERAFELSDLMEKEYGRKPNVFLYTTLIQACMQNGQVARSCSVFAKMLHAGVDPDAVTYGAVVRGCVQAGMTEQAMAFVRNASLKQAPSGCKSLEAPFPKAAVPVPPDALAVLMGTLRRKRQHDLVIELEAISVVPAPSRQRERAQ